MEKRYKKIKKNKNDDPIKYKGNKEIEDKLKKAKNKKKNQIKKINFSFNLEEENENNNLLSFSQNFYNILNKFDKMEEMKDSQFSINIRSDLINEEIEKEEKIRKEKEEKIRKDF